MNISHIIHILESGDKKADKREEKNKGNMKHKVMGQNVRIFKTKC